MKMGKKRKAGKAQEPIPMVNLSMRISEDEKARLNAIASKTGIGTSLRMRLLVKEFLNRQRH
jgi:predicted DNA-binding protein